jgi:hypothetical protein
LFALLQYDFLVLYPLNPTTLAKYREAFTPSRAKDDPSDADYAAELLMKHTRPTQGLAPGRCANAHPALSGGAPAPPDW